MKIENNDNNKLIEVLIRICSILEDISSNLNLEDSLNSIDNSLEDINNNLKKIVDEMYLSRVEKKE